MDWVNPTLPTIETRSDRPASQIASEPVEESEHDMSSLAIGFAARMLKRAASYDCSRGNYPDFKVSSGKRPKWSGLNEEVLKSLVVITSDSPKRASGAIPTLERAA